jgi:hypothetical protein
MTRTVFFSGFSSVSECDLSHRLAFVHLYDYDVDEFSISRLSSCLSVYLSDSDISSEATIDEHTLKQAVHNLIYSASYLQSIDIDKFTDITMFGDHLNANVADNESFNGETCKSPDTHDDGGDDDDDMKKVDYLYSKRVYDNGLVKNRGLSIEHI